MIIADRFPTTYSDTSYPLYEYERTNLITSLGDGFKNYWLGYMTYDVIPSVFFASELSTSTNNVSARRVNNQQNSPVGYTTDNYGYAAYQSAYIKETGFTPANSYNCYLNSMHARAYGTEFNFTTGNDSACQLAIMIETGSDESLGTHQSFVTKVLSGDDATTTGLITFLQGQRDMTLTHTINGVTVTHTLKSADIEDNGIVIFTGVANGTYYKLSVFIAGYGFTPAAAHDSSNTHNRIYHIAPTLKMYSDYGNYYVIRTHGAYAPSYTRVDVNSGAFNLSGNTGNIAGIGLLGGFDFTFKLADLQALAIYDFIYDGNTVAYKLSGVAQLLRVYKPSDVLHHFALIMRIPSGLSYGYIPGVYCPEVLDDGQFTGNLLTGTLSEDDVQPWQWGNITTDDFTEDDIPAYEPPGDEGADSGGDTIAPYDFTNTPLSAANNFTTLYALTTAQVAAFGSIMWASLADPNFWHAVGVEFSNDFSINPADMMRYFNFLRYYPFDLTPYSSQYISGIYIGRSTIPIQFPAGMEYPRRASRNLIQINGGEVTALLPAPYNSDDFFVSDPATQMQAHIPFCGSVQLSAAECYGRTLYLNYVVDLQSGAIQATISVQSDSYYIVATLAGTCGAGVQITANNNIEYLTRIATVATGGIASAATMATRGAQVAGAEGAAAAGVVGALTGTVSALAGLPPVTVHKQGSTTGFANYGGDPRAYITIQAPKRSIPDTYAKSAGYVSNKRARIGDLSGYTEMINPDLSGIAAHQDELAEIYRILQAGFFA